CLACLVDFVAVCGDQTNKDWGFWDCVKGVMEELPTWAKWACGLACGACLVCIAKGKLNKLPVIATEVVEEGAAEETWTCADAMNLEGLKVALTERYPNMLEHERRYILCSKRIEESNLMEGLDELQELADGGFGSISVHAQAMLTALKMAE